MRLLGALSKGQNFDVGFLRLGNPCAHPRRDLLGHLVRLAVVLCVLRNRQQHCVLGAHSGFVAGMMIALTFGLELKKKREKRYRL
jgi:hypothetical protein